MGSLADYIERYLKSLVDEAAQGIIEIQRRELAEKFNCVPSQINYVLKTRFTVAHGYIVETRRGGGGYIRIIKVQRRPGNELARSLEEAIGHAISRGDAEDLLRRLEDSGAIDEAQRLLVKSVLHQETFGVDPVIEDVLRARILKAILVVLMS
ncbi:MAG TPA: CtsR family transcriptional regulator [Firmicutes bacterium]|nr:CtsR family transcriptional regulator [Bacillota bacterium]